MEKLLPRVLLKNQIEIKKTYCELKKPIMIIFEKISSLRDSFFLNADSQSDFHGFRKKELLRIKSLN